MRRHHLWIVATILFWGISMNAQAQLKKGHFFRSFENESVTVGNAEQSFDQWFSLPSGTEWQLGGNSIDNLGMSRIEYRQYVDGVEVEHSQILLHARDGKVSSANGTVMEQEQAPAMMHRGYLANKTKTADLRTRKHHLPDRSQRRLPLCIQGAVSRRHAMDIHRRGYWRATEEPAYFALPD